MKSYHIILLAICLLIAALLPACNLATPPEWENTPNPLFEPGSDASDDAEQLHRENIRLITQNPAYELCEELAASWATNNPEIETP